MSSYMKWEFKSIIKENKVWFSAIALVFFFEFIFIKMDAIDNTLGGLLTVAFTIILMVSAFASFLYGTKRTLDTFKKPTFLLESMIPIPASKLLMAKYIIAIVMNILYTFIFVFGIFLIMTAVEDSLVIEMLGKIGKIILEQPTYLLRMFVSMICYSTAFTSIVTIVFCFFKSKFPNGKALGIVSFILGYFAFGMLLSIFGDMIVGVSVKEYLDFVTDGFMIILIVLGYFGTVYLIENKLEIYS